MIDLRVNPVYIASLSTGEDIVQTFKESVEAEGDCNFQIYDHHQVIVIRFPIIYGQLPVIAFGPEGANFYKPNKWISQEEYIKTIRILVNVIISWCK